MSRLVERLVGRPMTDEEKLTAGVVLTLTFMVFEGAFAIVAGSLAMLGDAAHMLSDAASFAVSLAALRVARRGPTMRHTYGLARVEVVGALASTIGQHGVDRSCLALRGSAALLGALGARPGAAAPGARAGRRADDDANDVSFRQQASATATDGTVMATAAAALAVWHAARRIFTRPVPMPAVVQTTCS